MVKTGCLNQNITADQAATTYSCSALSAGGSAAQVDVSIKRDATAPGITWSGGINDGNSFVYGSVPAAPTCSATDFGSGPDTCGVTGYGTDTGSYTLTATAYDKAGNVKTETRSYTVTPADATCSISGGTFPYDTLAHGASGSCVGIGGESAGTVNLGASFTNVAGGTAHWTLTGNDNYNDDAGDVSIVITPVDATCSISGGTFPYDTLAHGASGSCVGIGGESAGTVNLGASFTNVAGGTAHWTLTGNDNYNDDAGDVSIVITPVDATCSISGGTFPYDTLAHGASGSCVGIGGESAGTVNLGDSFTNVAGGTAHWTLTGNDNYNDNAGDVSIVITPVDATCSISGGTFPYDTLAHGASGSCVGIGGESAGTVNLGASFTNVAGGTAHWTLTGNDNYNDDAGDVSIVITPVDATCSISGGTFPYDTLAHGASGSCVGIGGESAGTVNLGASFTNVAGGTAHWTLTGNDNYNDDAGDVSIMITPVDATCSISGGTFPYDTLAHGASGSCVGIGGESAGTVNLGASFTNVAGGTAHWTLTGNDNYNDDAGDVSIVITPVDATCSISGGTFPYDTLAHGASGSCVGIGGESAGTVNLGASFTNVAGGTAHWTLTGNDNYNDDAGDVSIVITPVDATCSISGGTFPYDTLAHGASGSCVGIGGESAGTVNLGDSFTNVAGGTAHWTLTGNDNYNDDAGDVSIVITPVDATCSISGGTFPYDTLAHGASGSCVGIGGESAGTVNLGDSFTNVAGGTAHWTLTGNDNYNDDAGDVSIVITPVDATCSISGWSGNYDGNYHGATGSCSGIGGESAGTLNLGASFKDVPGGTAHWVFTGNGNYKDQSGDVTIVIKSWWTLNGFFQPVDMGNVWNTVKNGSTVPLKFRIFAGATELTDVSAVKSLAYKLVACTTLPGSVEDAIETLSPTGSAVLRYSDSQFIFNWKTPSTPTKCYQVTMTAQDASSITAFFKLK